MPILIAWGLPLSLASPIGNLVFLPFLMAFLFISANIFFLELLYIPNTWFIYVLEKITALWLWLINFGSPSWLISFAKPSSLLLMIIPISALGILYYKRIAATLLNSAALFILLLLISVFLKHQPNFTQQPYLEIPCNGGIITVIKKDKTITLIDPGVLGRKISTPSWIEFTLLPTLNQHFGTTNMRNLIILQPSIMTFECVEKICQLCTIKNFYMPNWQGTADKKLLRSYGFMRRALEKNKTLINRLHTKTTSPTKEIIITAFSDTVAYKEITFATLCVTIALENKTLEIYSSKKQK